MRRGALLAATGLIVFLRGASAQRIEAGLVDSIAGPRGSIRVFRGGESEDLARLSPLYAGDSISATGRGATARLRLYGRAPAWLCSEPSEKPPCYSHLEVLAPARGNGLRDGIRALVHGALGSIFGGGEWSRTVSTVSRGSGDIEVPLLASFQEIGAGKREIEVAWRGGEGPFSVRVTREGREIVTVRGLNAPEARLGTLDLAPGAYALRIEDSQGTEQQVRFRVVPHNTLPSPPKSWGGAEMSGGSRSLLTSAWLAGKRERRWSWEAYLRLGALRGDGMAERMRAELAAGRLP